LLKLLGSSKKDGEADNSGKVVEDKPESESEINPIRKKRKTNFRAPVIRARKASVLKKPYRKKASSR
jgi:hypothetical protein